MKITIIGLGEIGSAILKEINKKVECYGVDINNKVLSSLQEAGYNVGNEIPTSDIYIISVYTTTQVEKVIKSLDYTLNPLVVVESTVLPGFHNDILNWAKLNKIELNLVLFPHRFNPNDKKHQVFNLDRVIGCVNKKTEKRVLEFYTQFMKKKLIHKCPIEVAELAKPLENAYRFIEISIAEEIKMLCDKHNIDFKKLRRAINTKWNIDLKESKKGVGGKCLPKDTRLINGFFKGNLIFNTALIIDKFYLKYLKTRRR